MNNKTLIIVIGVVVIIGAIIGFMMMGKPSGEISNKNQVTPQAGNQKMSMKSLLASGKPQTCTFSNPGTEVGGNSSGTMQIANGKMRGDFTTTVASKTTQSHMLMIDNVNYVWGDEMPFGIKMNLSDFEKPENQKNQAVDLNQEIDYSCNPGTNDPNAFNLPAGVEFKDMNAMMKGMMPATAPGTTPSAGNMNTAQCGMCDSAPDAESRTQCRIALGCK